MTVLDSLILAMSMKKKEAIKRINNYSEMITLHLIKRFIIKDEQNYSYWEDEIDNWLLLIYGITLKPDNSLLKTEVMYKEFVSSSGLDPIKRGITTVICKEKPIKTLLRQIPDKVLEKLILNVFKEFCKLYETADFVGVRFMKSYKQALKEIEKYN